MATAELVQTYRLIIDVAALGLVIDTFETLSILKAFNRDGLFSRLLQCALGQEPMASCLRWDFGLLRCNVVFPILPPESQNYWGANGDRVPPYLRFGILTTMVSKLSSRSYNDRNSWVLFFVGL